MSRPPLSYAPDDVDAPFWDACRRHEFLLQYCPTTQQWYWPTVSDPRAGREGMIWKPASGLGTVHTFTVIHQIFREELANRVPYNVAVVELDEGPLFHTNVVDCDNRKLHVGMRVEVVFDDLDEGVTLPRFRPHP